MPRLSVRGLHTVDVNQPAAGQVFVTTHWSVVLAAGDAASTRRAEALEQLCRTYWYPLYAFARRRGQDEHHAKDLTQGFFAQLLARNDFSVADPRRGRFRTFLLHAFQNFLANEWDKSQRIKRGGGAEILSLDDADAETRYQLEATPETSPEAVFDRGWAQALLSAVFAQLHRELTESGDLERYEVVKPFLLGGEGSYAEAATKLGITETGVRSVVHRFRKRFRELIRAEIANTVSGAEEIDAEVRYLFTALG